MTPSALRRSLRMTMALAALLLVGLVGWRLSQKKAAVSSLNQPLAFADYGPVQDFSLTERSGQTVTLSDLKGTPWIADFIFTRCAGPCPLISFEMSKLQKKYRSTTDLKFVSFSVDPP